MSLGLVVSEVWSTPTMEAEFGLYPMWRCYAYIKVLDVLHDILYTTNPVWCRPITVHECKKIKILTGCTTCNRRYAEKEYPTTLSGMEAEPHLDHNPCV